MMTRTETAGFLLAQDRFCILTHRRPDGDTLGSAAALCRGLRKLGKTAAVLENPDMTDRFAPLLDGLTTAAPGPKDTLISVDVAAPRMLPAAFEPYLPRIALRIDHHASATGFTPRELVDAGAAACGEIIFDVLRLMGAALDADMAAALYTAVSTDTGCFRFANTTGHTLRVAAACADAGAPLFALNQTLFDTVSLARLRMQGWMVEHGRFLADGRMAICPIPKAVEEQLGAGEDDMDNLSSFLRSVEGVELAATLRESDDGTVKLSLRAVPGIDCGAICARFGGGGHAGAAGGTMRMPLEQAASALTDAMLEALA